MKVSSRITLAVWVLVIGLTGTVICGAGTPAPVAVPLPAADDTAYPYHGPVFTGFVEDSYKVGGSGQAADFYRWIEQAYQTANVRPPNTEKLSLEQTLEEERLDLAGRPTHLMRTQAELELATWLHRAVKTMLPKFSLDRGYEFRHSVDRLERQCFLQSVLIAGLLQRTGAEAGVVMIYRNQKGEASNLGHAAVVMRLDNGHDIIVDASDPQPFMRHRGLFARAPGYTFLAPVYDHSSPQIVGYKSGDKKIVLPTRQVLTLDVPYLRSQFWYYRGERVEGGPFSNHPTPEGLKASADYLETALEASPWNPLATYMLGVVNLRQGDVTKAGPLLSRAYGLYRQDGFVPDGPRAALAEVRRRAKSQGSGPKG